MPAAPTPTPTPSAGYTFSSVTPAAGGGAQGDMPNVIYAKPGAANTVFGANDQANISAGYQAKIPIVGWSFAAGSRANTGLAGLSNLANYANQGGTNYYSLAGTLEAWGQMTPDQRVTVQKQLLASGMYSAAYYPSGTSNAPSKQPLYGAAADFDTVQALQNAWNAASDTGQPLDTVLNQANAAAMNAARIYQQNTQVGTFDQSDPAELRGLADQQAVNVLGRKATADEKTLAVSMVQAAQVAYQQGKFNQTLGANRSDAAVQLAGGLGGQLGGTGSSIAGGGTPSTVNALVSALGGQESGSPTAGGYGAVNPDSGAAGRFQIMPSNWASWSQAAGLGPNAAMTPQNQEIVARNQISQYLSDGGGDPAYVAVAWYAGEATAKAFQADPTNPKWQKPQGKYPSIASYAQSITGKMAAAVPGTLATQSMAGQVGNLPADGSGGPGNAGSINVGQRPAGMVGNLYFPQQPATGVGAIPTTGSSLAGETGSIGATAGTGSGLTGTDTGTGQVPSGTVTGGQPTPAQLLPASTGIYTQVNPTADIAEMLRQNNPQTAGAHDLASVLDAVRQLFHG